MIIIDLPGGGKATLREDGELTPRQRRPLKKYGLALGPKMAELMAAASVTVDGKAADGTRGVPGPPVALSLADADLLVDMQDATTLALLASWTLDRPLPTTIDELYDVDEHTPGGYDALSTAAAKITAAAAVAAGFDVGAVEDPDSPTGA